MNLSLGLVVDLCIVRNARKVADEFLVAIVESLAYLCLRDWLGTYFEVEDIGLPTLMVLIATTSWMTS